MFRFFFAQFGEGGDRKEVGCCYGADSGFAFAGFAGAIFGDLLREGPLGLEQLAPRKSVPPLEKHQRESSFVSDGLGGSFWIRVHGTD